MHLFHFKCDDCASVSVTQLFVYKPIQKLIFPLTLSTQQQCYSVLLQVVIGGINVDFIAKGKAKTLQVSLSSESHRQQFLNLYLAKAHILNFKKTTHCTQTNQKDNKKWIRFSIVSSLKSKSKIIDLPVTKGHWHRWINKNNGYF